MSAKDKLRKFRENESFGCLYQPATEELLWRDYKLKGHWGEQVFKNSNPIVIELGCGRGEYTIALSKMFREINFIGIDIKGARLWKGARTAHTEQLPNVAFIRTRIEFIESLFAKDEISQIWITFPDPQIKRAKKRLTGSLFLKRYFSLLKGDGVVNLKTDSRFLHEYTLALVRENNLSLIEANNDIYGSGRADSILSIKTFYEAHYLEQGFPIAYIAFKIDKGEIVEPEWDARYWKKEEGERRGMRGNFSGCGERDNLQSL